MENFVFKNPTKIIFGKGEICKIADEIPSDAKVMLTYGGGSIKRNGVYEQVKKALENHDYVEFGGIEPNPEYETLCKAISLAKKEKVNFLLAVGGGSVIDGTKFIAPAINYMDSEEWDLILDQEMAASIDAVPIGTVLTLPATGSEMNNGAVISRRALKGKYVFFHPQNHPRFSVLDPEVCSSLPDKQIANGIIDTFVHVMEQYNTFPVEAKIQDRFSEGILNTMVEVGNGFIAGRRDYDLMANYMWGATMALNGLVGAGVPQDWTTHMIGHELTALHGLDHGVTLAIVYPAMLQVLKESKKEKTLQYAARVWGINNGSEESIIDDAINKTRSFFESLGVKTHLSDHGIGKDTIVEIHRRFKDNKTVLGENGTVDADVVKQILEAAM